VDPSKKNIQLESYDALKDMEEFLPEFQLLSRRPFCALPEFSVRIWSAEILLVLEALHEQGLVWGFVIIVFSILILCSCLFILVLGLLLNWVAIASCIVCCQQQASNIYRQNCTFECLESIVTNLRESTNLF